MTQEQRNNIEIIHGEVVLLTIDSDSPDLKNIIEKIILNDNIDVNKLECKSNIEDFDVKSFLAVITTTISSIKKALENNIKDYNSIKKTIQSDDSIETFYEELINNKNDEN